MLKYFWFIIAGVLVGFLLAAYLVHPKTKTVTKTVYKDKIVYAQMSGQGTIKPVLNQPAGFVTGSGAAPETKSQDFTASVPVSGEIKTKHVDIKFTGNTNVEKVGEQIKVNTIFNPTVNETIFQEPVKTWHVGLNIYCNMNDYGIGGYIQKDFCILKDLKAFGRVDLERDIELKAGIEYSF